MLIINDHKVRLWQAIHFRIGKFGPETLKVTLHEDKVSDLTTITLHFDFVAPIISTSGSVFDSKASDPKSSVSVKIVREAFRVTIDNSWLVHSPELALDHAMAELSHEVWKRFEELGVKDTLAWAAPKPFAVSHPEDNISNQVNEMLDKIPGLDKGWKKFCVDLFIDGKPLELLPETVAGNGPCRPSRGLKQMIIHLNDQHKLTREQIADWLDTLDMDLSFGGENDNDDTRSSN